MTDNTKNQMSSSRTPMFTEQFMTEPAEVKRTPAQKARILARLTLELAAIDKREGCAHGDA